MKYTCKLYGCKVTVNKYRERDPRAEFYWEDQTREVTERVIEHICEYWDKAIMRAAVDQMNFYKRSNPLKELIEFKPEAKIVGILKW